MRRVIPLLAAISIICTLAGCSGTAFSIKDGEYLAGGSIPAAAKAFPVYDDAIAMVKHDEDGALTKEDIYTITRYVDLFAALDESNRVPNEKDYGFLTTTSIEEIRQKASANAEEWEVLASQILSLDVLDSGEVQAVTVKRIRGSAEGYAEGEYDVVGGLFFKKTNSSWYENGIVFMTMKPAGTILFSKDDITGNYVISDVAEVQA